MTFTEHAALQSSQKILLAKVEAATRESGFTAFLGATHQKPFNKSLVISSVDEDGVAYVEGASSTTLTAGQYFYDTRAGVLYVQAVASDDPNAHFIAVSFFLFFSNRPLSLSHDLGAGFDVPWLPLLMGNSQFGVALDNKDTNLGNAIEGNGSLSFINDLEYWRPRYDKLTFENRRAFVYQYNLAIDDPTEARLIYKGLIQTKEYSATQVKLGLKDLFNAFRNVIPLKSLADFTYTHRILGSINANIDDSETTRKQRVVYGRPNGVALQNVDKATNIPYRSATDLTWEVTASSDVVKADTGTNHLRGGAIEGDQIEFSNQLGTLYTVKDIDEFASPDELTLTEIFSGSSATGVTINVIIPGRFYQRYQRYWLIAGHALSEFATTVTTSFTARLFRVSDVTGLQVGDDIIISGESRGITSISPGLKQVEVGTDFTFLPASPMTITRSPVRNLYFNGSLLEQNTHYTVDAATALVELDSSVDDHPEFFLSNVIRGKGTVDQTSNISIKPNGDDTDLQSQIDPGDWVLIDSDTVYRQVQYVRDDGRVFFFAPSSLPNATADGFSIRKPPYQENPIISADLIGKTEDATITGTPMLTGPVIARDLLIDAGLSADILSSSFDEASSRADHTLGLVIPNNISDTESKTLRVLINRINRSIFGTLFQNADYLLEYDVLDPTRDVSTQKLTRHDIVSFSVKSDSRSVVKTVIIGHNSQEVNTSSLQRFTDVVSFDSDIGQYLVKTEKVKSVDTLLIEQSSAEIFASRWARILELGRSLVSLSMKLQTTERNINDKIDFNHPDMYERFGSTFTRKIGLVNSIKRGAGDTNLVFDDLGNAFSKKSTIALDASEDFSSASEDEKMINGYITDDDGLVEGEGTIFSNLIW